MNEFDKALRYIFVLSMLLILVAYFAGASKLFSNLGSTTNSILLTLTGRGSSGQFSSYPANGPTV